MHQVKISNTSIQIREIRDSMADGLAERLVIAMRASGSTGNELAEVLGMSPSEFFQILDGKVSVLPPHKILALASRMQVSQGWLLSGAGPMRTPNAISSGARLITLLPFSWPGQDATTQAS